MKQSKMENFDATGNWPAPGIRRRNRRNPCKNKQKRRETVRDPKTVRCKVTLCENPYKTLQKPMFWSKWFIVERLSNAVHLLEKVPILYGQQATTQGILGSPCMAEHRVGSLPGSLSTGHPKCFWPFAGPK